MRTPSPLLYLAAVLAGCGSSANGNGGTAAPEAGTLEGDAGLQDSADVAPAKDGASTDASEGPDGAMDAGAAAEAGGDVDAAGPGDGGFVPAAHPPLPQLTNNGGPVLASPVVQPIFFSNYDSTAQVTTMLEGLPAAKLSNGDPFWTSAVGEYGVGALTVLPAIHLTDVAPTTDSNPATFLQGKLTDAAFKGITPSTILALFYPSTTPLQGSCAATAHGYGGYHDAFTNGSNEQPYAVMSECANFGPTTTALDMVTVAASHEIMEAATDPYPSSHPAYVGLDDSQASFAMSVLLQGNEENGDMCTVNDAFGRGAPAYPFLLQRGWSNKAAAGNMDPCAPDIRPTQPFVGAYPVVADKVTVMGQAGLGVIIPVGMSKTIDVKLFSYEPTPDFTVIARQAISVQPPTLSFSWNQSTGHNGDTLQLTITSVSAGKGGYDSFILQSSLPGVADVQKPAWAGVVTH